MHVLAELTPLDPTTGSRVTVRVSSAEVPAITGLGSQIWRAAMLRKPALTMKLFEGDFTSAVEPGTAAFSLALDRLARTIANVRRFVWQGATVTLYAGNDNTAWPWPSVFKGKVADFKAEKNRLDLQADVDTSPFDALIPTATYAGTSGIEGGSDLKGQVKPWVIGYARFVEPVLINAVDSVFQLSAYAAVKDVVALYERGAQFAASTGDYATYAALVAASIPPGRWATCKASGLIRLGAPPVGVITADVEGDYSGSVLTRLPGAVIKRAAALAGVSSGLLDSASLDALDAAVAALPNGGKIDLVLREQEKLIDFARRIARSCNWQAGVDFSGKLFVTRPILSSPSLTIDAQGRRKPGVLAASEIGVSPPFKKIQMSGERCWRKLSFDEIAFYARPTPRGLYDAATVYREGDIVDLIDGSTWLFVGATPLAGSYPAVGNANWDNMTGVSRKIRYDTSFPSAADSSENDLLIRTDQGNKIYRRVPGDGVLSFGGDPVTFGGVPVEFKPWQETSDARIEQALGDAAAAAAAAAAAQGAALIAQELAADAQATADGKVQSFYQSTPPTGDLAVGDLWFDTDDGNNQYRWSGSAWVDVQDTGIGDAIAAAAGAQATADGKVTTYYTASTPTASAIGDLWFNTSTQYLRRWNGSAWVDVANIGATSAQIALITQALTDAGNAQATADGKIDSYYQSSPPVSASVGDFWIDTGNGNRLYRWSGSGWVSVQDTGIGSAIAAAAGAQATADGKVTTFTGTSTPTAEGVGDLWFNPSTNYLKRWNGSTWSDVANIGATAAQIALINQAISDAAAAQATADGKIDSYYQSSAPAGASLGDFWVDTDDGNKLYRWSGSAWINIQDNGIGSAIAAAAGAQATADGKVTTFVGESTPTAEGIGDLWSQPSSGILRRWSGSAWEEISTFGYDGYTASPASIGAQVRTSASGLPKAGELPKSFELALLQGLTDLSEDSPTDYVLSGFTGISASLGGANGRVMTLDGPMTADRVVGTVSVVRDGTTVQTIPVIITKAKDGSSGIRKSTSVINVPSSGSYGTTGTDWLILDCPTGNYDLEASFSYLGDANCTVAAKWQVAVYDVGSATWGAATDVDSEVVSSEPSVGGEPGAMEIAKTYTVTAAGLHRFRLLTRRSLGTATGIAATGIASVEQAA